MKLFKSFSLRKTLLLYTLIFSLVMGCLLMLSAYLIALHESSEIIDAQMRYLAKHSIEAETVLTQSDFNPNKHYEEEDLFVDVWAYKDHSDQKHPLNLLVQPVNEAGFYTHKANNELWYTYVLPLDDVQIQVSQQQSVRKQLALELATSIFLPFIPLMTLMIIGLSWIIVLSLRPLEDLKLALAQRQPNDLHPIDHQAYPDEIMPTIQEINRLFEKISLGQQEQRQFIADAAHELRTPITALNLQSTILLKEFPDSNALQQHSKGLARIQHLVAQLLSLAQQDTTLPSLIHYQDFKLSEIAFNCIEQLIPFSLQKNIDLGLTEHPDIFMHSDESAIHSIIYNLIDNAIKYTPQNGMINVSLSKQSDYALIDIEDSGPGIDPNQYSEILKRFYRIENHTEIGSGLGLSIVNKATERLGGQLVFAKSDDLGGLKVTVKLPINMTPA
ncbi:MAG: GHKL domain-containing protein [Candidatus Acinetobacter avistercoris]|uniref:sensor histidine kinase n=1 Tax=Acinetobacter sp. KS-LM10 TaxID=3120518 RepID=UPI001FA0C1F0|nr:GHKL domain-containing protein [Candidatus Acinetobacter avistercoris]